MEESKTVDITIVCEKSFEEIKGKVLRMCEELVWKDVESSKVEVLEFTGGTTNKLYRCTLKEQERKEHVLLRVNGEGTELLLDRKQELENMKLLHEKGFGPKVYGTFNNGIVYGYFSGSPINIEDIRKGTYNSVLAENVAKWHSMEFPLEKEPMIWKMIENWLEQAPITHHNVKKDNLIKQFNVQKLREEFPVLREHLLSAIHSPVLFCHNDLQPLNLILDKESDSIHFIDYEYMNYNHRAFDIANHFVEYSGLEELDFTKFPGKDKQYEFYRTYLAVFHNKLKEEITENELAEMYVEVNMFVMASHFFWGCWALVQSKTSTIEWNYLEYGLERFNQYWESKKNLWNLQSDQL